MRKAIVVFVAAVSVFTPASAESWNAVSRSQTKVFLADADSIAVEGELTRLRVAVVPRTAEGDDRSHSIETYQFQCAAGKWRTAGLVEFGPDGAEAGAYPEVDAEWETVRANTLPDYLKRVACDGERAVPPVWPTLADFIAAGRP